MNHRFFTLLLICCSLHSALTGQNKYTLSQCLQAADEHTPLAQQQALIEEAHSAALSLLRNNYLPQAGLNGQATWQSEVTSLGIKIPNFETPTLSKDQYRATLDITQPIWDGGLNTRQKDVQGAQTLVEQQRLRVDRYALREQTMQLYCSVLLAQKQIEALETAQKDIQTRKKRGEEQVANGTAIPSNIYVFEARLLELDQQIDEARARIAAATEGLALLTGLPMTVTDRIEMPRADVPGEATIERAEMTYYSLQQQALSSQQRTLRSKSMPRFNAIATLGYARPGLNFLSNAFQPYAILGVNFKWNLSPFYTGSISTEQQQLRIQSDRIATQRAQFLLQTQVRQRQQNSELDRLKNVLKKDQAIIALRDKVVTTAEVQLENGIITPSEYLTESTQAVNARLNASLHEIQLLQSVLQLSFTQGKL